MQLEANRGCGKHAWVFKTSNKQNHSSRELGLGSWIGSWIGFGEPVQFRKKNGSVWAYKWV
jgi:hypothetical protein